MATTRRGSDAGASKPQYKVKFTKDVYVTMRDGVRIALAIYQPDAEGEFPALFAASPYQYDLDYLPAHPMFLWRETGPIEWYVERGYAYVRADIRGSGNSEGAYGFLDRTEQEDLYELIEWVAGQPWCSGKVGGFGESYYAMVQWLAACLKPPHLACIAPYDGVNDLYRGSAYHGGIYCPFWSNWYDAVRLNNLYIGNTAPTRKAIEYDLAYHLFAHPTADDWWRERSASERLSEITIPVYSIGHWRNVDLHLRGNLQGYEEAQGPKKLLITGTRNNGETQRLFETIEFHEQELLPFYDCHLKGVDNGFMDGPPVRLFIRGDNEWRDEAEWPLQRATHVPFYLRKGPSGSVTSLNDGGLSATTAEADEGSVSYGYPDPQWAMGVVALGEHGPDPVRRVLTFTSPPLEEDLEVTGPILLELFASSDQPDMDFIVKLADQGPLPEEPRHVGAQPPSTLVTRGWLRASHQQKDPERSRPYRPYYTHRDPRPIEPGTVYQFDIEVVATCYVFKKGHRIRLEVVNGDSVMTDYPKHHHYLPFKVGNDTIYHDAAHPSRLLLPVVPR